MNRGITLLAVCFCAAQLGALISSLTAWATGELGLALVAGVDMAPELSGPWLFPRLLIGGLWGTFYFLTVGGKRSRCHWVRKGLWISLLPTAFELLWVYPHINNHGNFGLALGALTPAFILFFNFVWGTSTGIFTRILWGKH